MNIESRLRRVEAAEQIRLLKARYCDLCDQGYPADELCSLFTEDGIWDGGEMGVFEGRDALHRFFSNMPDIMSFAIHHVTNSAVEVNDDATGARCMRTRPTGPRRWNVRYAHNASNPG